MPKKTVYNNVQYVCQREQIYNIEQVYRKINEFVHNRIKLVVYIKMYIAYKSFFKYFL